jgi:hypothetical protein
VAADQRTSISCLFLLATLDDDTGGEQYENCASTIGQLCVKSALKAKVEPT